MASPMKGVIPRNSMNASELLYRVQQAESSLPASSVSFFGHPPLPTLHACHIDSNDEEEEEKVILLVARTRRCVCVQLWTCPTNGTPDDYSSSSSEETTQPSEVMEMLRLDQQVPSHVVSDDGFHTTQDEEESITCTTVLSLDESLRNDKDAVPRLSPVTVVVGTNYSRVLSMELVMESWTTGQRTLRWSNETRHVFEPLPLDRASPIRTPRGDDGTNDNDQRFAEMSTTSENDANEKQSESAQEKETEHPFSPAGGVTSLNSFVSKTTKAGRLLTFLWVSYRDGTMVRLHHGGFFASVIIDQEMDLGPDVLTRTRVLLPPVLEAAGVTVLPLPKYHPSPLSPLPPLPAESIHDLLPDENTNESSTTTSQTAEEQEVDYLEYLPHVYEALSYGIDSGTAGLAAGEEDLPALSFHTSENHFDRYVSEDSRGDTSQDHEILDNVIGGTKKLVRGVFGTAIGAVKWGLRRGGGDEENKDKHLSRAVHELDDSIDADPLLVKPSEIVVTFPGVRDAPTDLFTGLEIHDAPRQVTFASVDPDGNLAAAADNLGRVLLIDLATKQVVRMWKGVREASCCWIQVPRRIEDMKPRHKKSTLYLVIHSQQRRVVEVWRMRHGPTVKTIQVGRDAQIVQYRESSDTGSLASCFLVHSASSGQNQVEPLTFNDAEAPSIGIANTHSSSHDKNPIRSTQEAALRLQLLKQLLADTNVPSNTQAVYEAFTSITSLTDLSSALDLLAVSSQLEKNMGVDGSSFQSVAVSYCREKLDGIVKGSGDKVYQNAHVKEFLSKITYHTQVVDAYNVLYKFETTEYSDDEEDINLLPRSAWAIEALGWVDTYERVTDTKVGTDETTLPQTRDPLLFASFANACIASDLEAAFENGVKRCRHHVHFTDSTRTRTEILVHVFQPLLQDVFAFKVVKSIFENLGISTDYDYLLKCFGEWFVTLPARQALRKSFFIWNSPMVRWLQGVVTSQLDDGVFPDSLLRALHSFCSESENLVRAFLLAALCREAVSVAARQKEEKTYGKVSYAAAIKPWESLLRKLRVCTFVSLRLHGIRLGSFPITVSNVDADDIFSIYEWLARDELFVGHKQDEIAMLEASCRESGLIFHPSLEEGDDPQRVKRLHKACTTRVSRKNLRPGASSRDDKPGALLLYLSNHNDGTFLVAHRALLLSGMWGQRPSGLHVLKDALSALQALDADSSEYKSSLVAAVSVELWQTHVRPVHRAFLFGFHDVPELSEDVMSPLCGDADWLRGVGQIALEILSIISRIQWDEQQHHLYPAKEEKENQEDGGDHSEDHRDDPVWPPVREDFILKRLVERTNPVEPSALALHRAVICATLLSPHDLSLLTQCVSGFYDTFLQTSLFSAPAPVAPTDVEKKQRELFVQRAVVAKAQRTMGGLGLIGPVLDNLELGVEINTLAMIWGVAGETVRTTFLLAMYELGKDVMVDDLVTSHVQHLDVDRFVHGGIDIACRRLDWTIADVRGNSEKRHVLALLDAETCQWIRERTTDSDTSPSLLERYAGANVVTNVALSQTHTFILRLLSLSSAAGPKLTRIEIHSLSVLSGTLLREHVQNESPYANQQ